MERAPSSPTPSPAGPAPAPTPKHLLCAYSPRWLSGPVPRYNGLCATWDGDEPTAEQPVVSTN